ALGQVAGDTDVDGQAAALVATELVPAWEGVAARAARRAEELGMAADEEIRAADRCLSPSDFGFHNALLGADRRLRFLDFEDAAWDDPAKLICDFFCQPAVPAPREEYERFAAGVTADLSDPAWHRARAALLLPAYRVKWCCILLNDFLSAGARRRRFAAADQPDRQLLQLAKARHAP